MPLHIGPLYWPSPVWSWCVRRQWEYKMLRNHDICDCRYLSLHSCTLCSALPFTQLCATQAGEVSAVLTALIHSMWPGALPYSLRKYPHSLKQDSCTNICGCRLDSMYTICKRHWSYLAYCSTGMCRRTVLSLLKYVLFRVTHQYCCYISVYSSSCSPSLSYVPCTLIYMHNKAACIVNVCPKCICECCLWKMKSAGGPFSPPCKGVGCTPISCWTLYCSLALNSIASESCSSLQVSS